MCCGCCLSRASGSGDGLQGSGAEGAQEKRVRDDVAKSSGGDWRQEDEIKST